MKLTDRPVVIRDGRPQVTDQISDESRKLTISGAILDAHDAKTDRDVMHITFDSLTSHDITYVGILQTARASGLEKFPVPYVLTNCHNTLCAVGGTINEDDHAFALSAAHKYGGIYVPPCYAVIHSYNREMMSGCGRMILGSDSHTRYGALGTMGIGEGGGEIAKQLLKRTYDIRRPETVLVWMTGKPRPGVGPHDVALKLVQMTYANGFVKNRVLEFAGEGIANLSQDYRNAIDVMTTETTCLSSIWETDETTKRYFEDHGRPEAYRKLSVQEGAGYDRMIEIDLSAIECMIALPMHPSHAVPIREFKKDPARYLNETIDRIRKSTGKDASSLLSLIDEEGRFHVQQGVIAGCSGGVYENIVSAAKILKGKNTGNGTFRLSVYPDSMPVYKSLAESGVISDLLLSGAVFREAFCGPCFGAGDTPANLEFSIRHTTRNFPNREGSKPNEGQMSYVALMDARSIAATAAAQGILTAADEVTDIYEEIENCPFDRSIYDNRVYNGWGNADPSWELRFGPNIKDWPEQPALSDDILIKVVTHIDDPVTTTDELIPSGETSSYRSNPIRLAQFTLSRRDPAYVPEAQKVMDRTPVQEEIDTAVKQIRESGFAVSDAMNICSAVYANRPGDGSAREQAASCQRVLGGGANFALEYATKRYRSNCINFGILPFTVKEPADFEKGQWIYIHNVRDSLLNEKPFEAYALKDGLVPVEVSLGYLTQEEKKVLADGCLINYYRN
ncbi:MAG: hydratase [Solobacterium sp.]|nr:hydratase [Solobacterium sp.]